MSFSQAQGTAQPQIIGSQGKDIGANAKQQIIHQLSKYIKLKQTEVNLEMSDDIMENLKECKYS